jgi:hypothetical protein
VAVALAFADAKYADNKAVTTLASLLRTAIARATVSAVDHTALLGGYRAAVEGRQGYSTPNHLDAALFTPLFREVGAMLEVSTLTMALVEVLQALGEDIAI